MEQEWIMKKGCRNNGKWSRGRAAWDGRKETCGRMERVNIEELFSKAGNAGHGGTDGKGGCIRRLSGFALALALAFLQREPMMLKAADYEARINGTYYERLEEAFNDAKPGDTVFVLRDCSVSETLAVNAEGIVLKSEDGGNPAVVSRDEDFTGKDDHQEGVESILVRVDGGSLATQDIILDGGAVLDGDFRNSGQEWESPLVYVRGTYRMESGTVLQNNYNMDGNEDNSTARFAGAVQVMEGGTFNMCGGIIRNCYTNGSGGGVHARNGSSVSMESGNIWNCYGMTGGAMAFFGPAEVSGMTLSGNCAKTGGAVEIHNEVRLSGCVLENNRALLRGGAVGISGDCPVTVEGCLIAGNSAAEGSAASISDAGGNCRPVFRDCTITGNRVSENYCGAIHYMGKAGLVLDGDIIVGDNTAAGGTGCDIFFMYADAAPVSLGEGFNSSSVFALCGSDGIVSGKLLIDASSQGKTADTEHFLWSGDGCYTEARDGDIYLADAPERYILFYDANNGGMDIYEDPGRYTSEDAAAVAGWHTVFSDENVKAGCVFSGWNTKADGTGIDYQEGQEIHLTENLWLYAMWEEGKGNVTVTYIYNGGSGEKEREQVAYGSSVILPDAFREGYVFQGWYEDKECTAPAGAPGSGYAPERDMKLYAGWEKEEPAGGTEPIDGGNGGVGNGENGGADNEGDEEAADNGDGADNEGNGNIDSDGDGEGNGNIDGSGEDKEDGNTDGSGAGEGNMDGSEDSEGDGEGNMDGSEDSEGDGDGNGDSGGDEIADGGAGGKGNEDDDSSADNTGDTGEDAEGGGGNAEEDTEDGKENIWPGGAGEHAAGRENGIGKDGKKEPVIQTGRFSSRKFFFLAGVAGVVLVLSSSAEEKRGKKLRPWALAGIIMVFASLSGIGIFRYWEVEEMGIYKEISEIYRWRESCEVPQGESGTGENGVLETQGEVAWKGQRNGVLGMKGETTGKGRENRILEIKRKSIGREQEGEDTVDYDWENLCSVNPDTAGWLYLPDSLIDFPVAAASDNEFYLSHDFTGALSRIGCLFMDKGTHSGDFNRVIYGHNMGAGSEAMFSTLLKYEEEKYFDRNRFLYFADVYGGSARYEVMAVVKYNVKDVMEWDFRERNFSSVEDYEVWMGQMQERALYFRRPERETGRMITLSTCDRREYGKDGRFLVFASGI